MSSNQARYFARSASDRTDDWPFWFVADRQKGGLNVTVPLLPLLWGHSPFLPRNWTEALAEAANKYGPDCFGDLA